MEAIKDDKLQVIKLPRMVKEERPGEFLLETTIPALTQTLQKAFMCGSILAVQREDNMVEMVFVVEFTQQQVDPLNFHGVKPVTTIVRLRRTGPPKLIAPTRRRK